MQGINYNEHGLLEFLDDSESNIGGNKGVNRNLSSFTFILSEVNQRNKELDDGIVHIQNRSQSLINHLLLILSIVAVVFTSIFSYIDEFTVIQDNIDIIIICLMISGLLFLNSILGGLHVLQIKRNDSGGDLHTQYQRYLNSVDEEYITQLVLEENIKRYYMNRPLQAVTAYNYELQLFDFIFGIIVLSLVLFILQPNHLFLLISLGILLFCVFGFRVQLLHQYYKHQKVNLKKSETVMMELDDEIREIENKENKKQFFYDIYRTIIIYTLICISIGYVFII